MKQIKFSPKIWLQISIASLITISAVVYLVNATTIGNNIDTGGNLLVSGDAAIHGTTTLSGNLNAQASSTLALANFGYDLSSSTDDYVVNLLPPITAYNTGLKIAFMANTANTGAATLNVNGLGAKSLKIKHDQDPTDNYIEAGSIMVAYYDGTYFQIIQQSANSNPGSLTVVKNTNFAEHGSSNPNGVANQNNVQIASFKIIAGANEGLIISKIVMADDAGIQIGDNFTNLILKHNYTQIGSSNTGHTIISGTYDFVPDSPINIDANQEYIIDVYANTKSSPDYIDTDLSPVIKFSSLVAIGSASGESVVSPTTIDLQQAYITSTSIGSYTAEMDTNLAGISTDKNILAGAESLVGRLKFTAQSETARIVDLSLAQIGTATDTDISAVALYSDQAMTQEIASTSLSSTQPNGYTYVKFESVNYNIPTAGATYIYIGVTTKPIDYSVAPAAGSTGHAGNTIIFTATSTDSTYSTRVKGVTTGLDLSNSGIALNSTKTSTMLGAIISNISTTFPNGALSNGASIKVFSFRVTVPTPLDNIAYDSTNLGIQLATTTFAISTTTGVKLSNYKIQRVGGASGKVAAVIDPATATAVNVGWQNTYGASTDLIVRPGETAEYEIYADIAGVILNSSVQVSITDLTTFFYNHTTTDANTYTANYYPIISGVSDVIGGTLTN